MDNLAYCTSSKMELSMPHLGSFLTLICHLFFSLKHIVETHKWLNNFLVFPAFSFRTLKKNLMPIKTNCTCILSISPFYYLISHRTEQINQAKTTSENRPAACIYLATRFQWPRQLRILTGFFFFNSPNLSNFLQILLSPFRLGPLHSPAILVSSNTTSLLEMKLNINKKSEVKIFSRTATAGGKE